VDFHPTGATNRLRLLKQSSNAKIMVRNDCLLTKLHFFYSTSFNLIAIFRAVACLGYLSSQTHFCLAVAVI
jgi:hypothetical protein